MLYPNPDRPPFYITAPKVSAAEIDLAEYEAGLKRRDRAKRFLAGMALATSSFGILAGTPYWADIAQNVAEEQKAKPSIRVIAEPLDEENTHKATLVFVGFNSVKADHFSVTMKEFIQENADGEIWSIQYNNAPLDSREFYNSILELAEKRDITSFSVVTHSMGDEPGSTIGADIFVHSPLLLENIVSVVGPVGYDTLQPDVQEEYNLANFLSTLTPSLAHSTLGRFALEYWFYRDTFTTEDGIDSEKLLKLSNEMQERFDNGQFTTNSFLLSQIDAITHSRIKESIEAIGENPLNKPLPRFINYSPGKGGYDATVDNDAAIQKRCTYVVKAGMDCFSQQVPGITHSEYYRSVDEYLEAAKNITRKIDYVERYRQEDIAPSQTLADQLATGDEPPAS